MPTNLQNNSLANGTFVLIAAVSGRAIAESARRSGFTPLVADFFADQDTRSVSHSCIKIDGAIEDGLSLEPLMHALNKLSEELCQEPEGVVCGSGFESVPEILTEIGRHWRLLGNDPDTVEKVNNPLVFFPTLQKLGLRHPVYSVQQPAECDGWLLKSNGGAGGGHIQFARPGQKPGRNQYFQKFSPGKSVSVLFLGNGEDCFIIGHTDQWSDPAPGAPMRYGGAIGPSRLPADEQEQIKSATKKITKAFSLKGLCSIDFLMNEGLAIVLEVNPRPGATLDIFDCVNKQLFKQHLNALSGVLPDRLEVCEFTSGSAIVYADNDFIVPANISWPHWASDRPAENQQIKKNEPVCTVSAVSKVPKKVKRVLHLHDRQIRDLLGAQ